MGVVDVGEGDDVEVVVGGGGAGPEPYGEPVSKMFLAYYV